MTHDEREAYVQKLMSVLEGDGPEIVVTESGALETLPDMARVPPLAFPPRSTLTSADRRDRTALRALRAEVLGVAARCEWPFPSPVEWPAIDPVALIVFLSRPVEDIPVEDLHRMFPSQVWSWVSQFQHIQYRAMGRWLDRGYGVPENFVIQSCKLWTAIILWGKEHLLPR
jgi:hypothetical protein